MGIKLKCRKFSSVIAVGFIKILVTNLYWCDNSLNNNKLICLCFARDLSLLNKKCCRFCDATAYTTVLVFPLVFEFKISLPESDHFIETMLWMHAWYNNVSVLKTTGKCKYIIDVFVGDISKLVTKSKCIFQSVLKS